MTLLKGVSKRQDTQAVILILIWIADMFWPSTILETNCTQGSNVVAEVAGG